MKKICQIKGNLSLFLIGAILVLCAGFVITGCGAGSSGSQQKAKDSDEGAYAVDFSVCPDDVCYATLNGSDAYPIPSIEDKEFSIEAWVKRRSETVTGAIFSRLDAANGTALYIKDNEPKFAIRVLAATTSTESSPTPTATYTVGSGVTLVQDAWTHIIGIITNTAHSHPASTSCTTTVMAETPHLDIYVDGEFKNCATTWGYSSSPIYDPATGPQFADNPASFTANIGQMGATLIDGATTITTSDNLEAAIDELRIWMSARTAADIVACINTELGLSGTCNRLDSSLVAYFRFNNGPDADPHKAPITDFSGSGLSTGLITRTTSSADEPAFTTGWVSGNPSLQRAD